MVDDGAVLRPVDDLHGNKLGAEGQHVELGSGPSVLVHHLGDGLTLNTPAGEFENRDAVLLRFGCCGAEERARLNRARQAVRRRGLFSPRGSAFPSLSGMVKTPTMVWPSFLSSLYTSWPNRLCPITAIFILSAPEFCRGGETPRRSGEHEFPRL